jgi:vacuolar-type H+-ATPase subunit I/STV1
MKNLEEFEKAWPKGIKEEEKEAVKKYVESPQVMQAGKDMKEFIPPFSSTSKSILEKTGTKKQLNKRREELEKKLKELTEKIEDPLRAGEIQEIRDAIDRNLSEIRGIKKRLQEITEAEKELQAVTVKAKEMNYYKKRNAWNRELNISENEKAALKKHIEENVGTREELEDSDSAQQTIFLMLKKDKLEEEIAKLEKEILDLEKKEQSRQARESIQSKINKIAKKNKEIKEIRKYVEAMKQHNFPPPEDFSKTSPN